MSKPPPSPLARLFRSVTEVKPARPRMPTPVAPSAPASPATIARDEGLAELKRIDELGTKLHETESALRAAEYERDAMKARVTELESALQESAAMLLEERAERRATLPDSAPKAHDAKSHDKSHHGKKKDS